MAAAGLAAVLAWSMLRTPLPPSPDSPDVASAAALVRPWLQDHAGGGVRIRLGVHDQWPLAAGVIDRLDRRGLDVTVDPEWVSLFGDQFDPTGRETAEIWITDRAAAPPVHGPQPLGTTAGASLWAGPLTARGTP